MYIAIATSLGFQHKIAFSAPELDYVVNFQMKIIDQLKLSRKIQTEESVLKQETLNA